MLLSRGSEVRDPNANVRTSRKPHDPKGLPRSPTRLSPAHPLRPAGPVHHQPPYLAPECFDEHNWVVSHQAVSDVLMMQGR